MSTEAEQAAEVPAAELPHIPEDLLTLVLANLEVRDLVAASQVSRDWRTVAGECDAAWHRHFLAEFGEVKAADFTNVGQTWREKYIACLLDNACHKLRSKARYLDELEDSSALLEKNAQTLLTSLNQMDRTLSHRRHDLNALLASVGGKPSIHMDSRRGKELLELAARGGDLAAAPQLTPDACEALLEMRRDVEFWSRSVAEERDSLHRMWDSLSYIQACSNKVRDDIRSLQQCRAQLEAATRYRPPVRRC